MALTWPSLDEGKFNLIATDVTAGFITQLNSKYTYWITSVATGATAPIDSIKDKSPVIFKGANQEEILSQSGIDVYIWIEDADTDTDATGVTNAIQVDV